MTGAQALEARPETRLMDIASSRNQRTRPWSERVLVQRPVALELAFERNIKNRLRRARANCFRQQTTHGTTQQPLRARIVVVAARIWPKDLLGWNREQELVQPSI